MSQQRVKRKELIPKLRENRGNLAACGRYFHVTRERIRQIVAADDELSQIVFEERESFLDVAENKLYDAIEDGNVVATIFFLKTQGKSRGYVERAELVPLRPQGFEVELGVPISTIENGEAQALNSNRTTSALLEQ